MSTKVFISWYFKLVSKIYNPGPRAAISLAEKAGFRTGDVDSILPLTAQVPTIQGFRGSSTLYSRYLGG